MAAVLMAVNTPGPEKRLTTEDHQWDFWFSFAWIRTRSLDIAREIEQQSKPDNSSPHIPLVLRRVVEHANGKGERVTDNLWRETWVQLAGLCSEGKVRAFAKPYFGSALSQMEAIEIDQIFWPLATTVTGNDLHSGGREWRQLKFNMKEILSEFPAPRTSSRNRFFSLRKAHQFVDRMIAADVPQNQLHVIAQREFPIDQVPPRAFLVARYKELTPAPLRGRRPKKPK
jgi:hypothetical protein